MKQARTVCVAFAMGCPRNQMDTAWLSSYFRANGWTVLQRVQNADLVVASACGFAANVEEESLRLLSLLDQRRRKDSKLIVTGCLAGINGSRVTQQFGAVTIRPADIHQLDDLIGAKVRLQDIPPVNCVEPHILAAQMCWPVRETYPNMGAMATLKQQTKRALCSLLRRVATERFAMRTVRRFRRAPQDESSDPTFYIRVARGCLEECTYCAIRHAAGTLQSKPLDKILAEFDLGLAQKHANFEILAEDIGSYGLDIGSGCVELFERLFQRPGSYKLVLTDINVRYLIQYTPALCDLLATNADRIRMLKVPIQSGSDRILRLMKRQYTRDEMQASLTYLREKAPSLPLETHVLVGFPGETDEDFEDTMDLLGAIRFDRIQIYRYTDRPNTSARDLPDKVPEPVKEQRIQHLQSVLPQIVAPEGDPKKQDRDDTPDCLPARPTASRTFAPDRYPDGIVLDGQVLSQPSSDRSC